MSRRTPRSSRGSAEPASRSRDAGALYVHLQSDSGVEHRTIVLSPGKVRVLRALWSWWGVALVLAVAGSWVYFAAESARIPLLNRRVADLKAESERIDTLQAKLEALQEQYDQVYRMLGVAPVDTGKVVPTASSPARRQ